ncbi:LOW QUALITY PROTEIN: hypothetical protein V1477_013093 [Vespula maculifrons]|uniref:Uncharacterized protein n=1 Tax=Vespula maculifrons TaxID=7453 RepID=A0ABD2BUX5_VESMC
MPYDLFRFRMKWMGIFSHSLRQYKRQLLVQSCFEFRRVRIVVLPVRVLHSNCKVGIVHCEREQQRRAFDRLLQLLVQLCFGLRRGNSETFAKAIPTIFCTIKLRSGDSPLRERKTKTGFRPTFTVSSSVVFWTSTRELGKFRGGHSYKYYIKLRSGDTRLRERKTKMGLRPPLTVTSSVVFGTSTRELGKFCGDHSCKLNCKVGIVHCERGQQRRTFDRLLQLLVQLCFGLRQGNSEKFAKAIPTIFCTIKLRSGDSPLRERKTKTGLRPSLTVTCSVVFETSTRELRKISWRSFQQINLRSGDTRLRERKTKTGLRPPLTVTSSVVFGTSTRELRKISWRSFQQINLRSGDTRLRERKTKTGLRPPLTVTSSVVFGTSTRELRKISWRSFQQINLRSGDTRLRERTTKKDLRSPLTVTSSVVFWTSTRELRKFRGAHSCNLYDFRLNCEVGIFGCERRQQSCAFDRLSSITIVQSCFGLRRGNIEIFAGCYSSEYSRRVYANFYVALSRDLEFISTKPHCNRARSNESQCITEEDLDQLRCRPTSFSTNYESSTLNFDLNRGPVFWSHRRTSQVNSSKMALNTTGRVSRCLKPTVWTVEHSVSGVLYISSLLRSPKLPKRKGISVRGFRVDSPLARGSQSAATSTWWDLDTTGRVSRCLKPTVWTVEQSVSGVLYISSLLRSLKLPKQKGISVRVFRVDSPLARGSSDAATSTWWDLGRHDRSCLEMSEADGVDSGAICKRGFIHLQFAEKPEAPEAERHLGSRI